MNRQLSNVEDRLREAYRAAADTIDPDRIRPFREPEAAVPSRRPGRVRRWPGARARMLVPLAAAAAIVAIAAGVPAVLSRFPLSASRPQATQTAPAVPPGAPRFFVAVWSGDTALNVYQTATAKLLATIQAPRESESFSGVAATGDPTRYVVAVGNNGSCGTKLYMLRLTAGGQFAGVTPLAVPSLPREQVFSLAVTPDARYVAYAGQYCSGPNLALSDIGFVNLAGKSVRRWMAPASEWFVSLSLTANGSRIGFVIRQTGEYEPAAGILPTSGPAGSVADDALFVDAQRLVIAHSKIVPTGTVPAGAVPGAAAIASDGRALYICGVPSGAGADPLLTYSGGKLAQRGTLAGGGSCVLSLDPSGRFLLAQTSTAAGHATVRLELIDLASGSVTPLHARGYYAPQDVTFTW